MGRFFPPTPNKKNTRNSSCDWLFRNLGFTNPEALGNNLRSLDLGGESAGFDTGRRLLDEFLGLG